jgi:hypothetical protein
MRASDIEQWRKADEVIRYMASQGVIADVIIFERNQVNRMSMPEAQRYLRYVIARYAAFPNVVWCLQNEWEYTQKPKAFWSEVGTTVSHEDPWARQGALKRGLSVHQQTRYDWEFPNEDWFSHIIVQLGVRNRGKAFRGGDEWNLPKDRRGTFRNGDDWGNFSILYNWKYNVPVVNDEYGYIGEPADETEPKGPDGKPTRYTREKHRRTMWAIYAGAGYGSAGDKNQFLDGRPYVSANWHDEIEWGDVKRLIDFYTSNGVRYWDMRPCNEAVTAGQRVYVETNRECQYVVYAAAGGTFSIQLAEGQYQAKRFDPRTGEFFELGRSGGGVRQFSMPDTHDWVVYLHSAR